MKNIINAIWNVLTALLVVIEIVAIAFIVITKTSGGEPSLFGYKLYVIVSESMEPEIMVGDVILSKEYDGQELKVGDVVTFIGKEGKVLGQPVTHKIISVTEDKVVTQGVANTSPDPEMNLDEIKAIMIRKTVVIGAIYSIISTTWGFVLLVIIPIALMAGGELIRLIKVMKEGKTEGEENEGQQQD